MTEDSELLGPAVPQRPEIVRPMLLIGLSGTTLVRSSSSEHLVDAGSILTWSLGDPGSFRHQGQPSVILSIDWAPGSLGTRSFDGTELLRLSPGPKRRLMRLAGELGQPLLGPLEASHKAEALLSLLREEGLPLDNLAPGDLYEEVPPALASLWQAVDLLTSSLHRRPMVQDLEQLLGHSGRLIHDRLKQFHSHFSFHSTGGWRDHLRRWRLPLGAAVMSSPSARTEDVAALLGYASATEFCRAFANAGLPSPGSIRERLRQLG